MTFSGGIMALKPITLRLDEEEYEKLKEALNSFGDPDINVAYILRSYIRDLNRALPFFIESGWDLKNYFGLLGSWLNQFGSRSYFDTFSKIMANTWMPVPAGEKNREEVQKKEKNSTNDNGSKEE